MTDINQALSLYDMANQIDRLRFQIRALPASIPSVSAAFAPVHTLTGIITAVSDEVSRRLAGHISSDEAKAIDAFGDAFIPLGEAVTELGRMHSEVAFFNFTTYPPHSGSSPDLERLTRRSEEVISGCREAADAILRNGGRRTAGSGRQAGAVAHPRTSHHPVTPRHRHQAKPPRAHQPASPGRSRRDTTRGEEPLSHLTLHPPPRPPPTPHRCTDHTPSSSRKLPSPPPPLPPPSRPSALFPSEQESSPAPSSPCPPKAFSRRSITRSSPTPGGNPRLSTITSTVSNAR